MRKGTKKEKSVVVLGSSTKKIIKPKAIKSKSLPTKSRYSLYLDTGDYKLLKQMCGILGMKLSDFLRIMIKSFVNKLPAHERDITFQKVMAIIDPDSEF